MPHWAVLVFITLDWHIILVPTLWPPLDLPFPSHPSQPGMNYKMSRMQGTYSDATRITQLKTWWLLLSRYEMSPIGSSGGAWLWWCSWYYFGKPRALGRWGPWGMEVTEDGLLSFPHSLLPVMMLVAPSCPPCHMNSNLSNHEVCEWIFPPLKFMSDSCHGDEKAHFVSHAVLCFIW